MEADNTEVENRMKLFDASKEKKKQAAEKVVQNDVWEKVWNKK